MTLLRRLESAATNGLKPPVDFFYYYSKNLIFLNIFFLLWRIIHFPENLKIKQISQKKFQIIELFSFVRSFDENEP